MKNKNTTASERLYKTNKGTSIKKAVQSWKSYAGVVGKTPQKIRSALAYFCGGSRIGE